MTLVNSTLAEKMKLDTGINKNNTTMNISIYILLKIHKLQIHVYNF